MDELFSSEYCCSIGSFFHSWNVLLLVVTLNKAFCFAITNTVYLCSILLPSVTLVWAVAYAWCLSLVLIFPAAIADRILFYTDRSYVCQEGDECTRRGNFLVNAGQSLMFLAPFLVYIALLQFEYAKRVSRTARIKLDSEKIKQNASSGRH